MIENGCGCGPCYGDRFELEVESVLGGYSRRWRRIFVRSSRGRGSVGVAVVKRIAALVWGMGDMFGKGMVVC